MDIQYGVQLQCTNYSVVTIVAVVTIISAVTVTAVATIEATRVLLLRIA
jgi:hypothetical protein